MEEQGKLFYYEQEPVQEQGAQKELPEHLLNTLRDLREMRKQLEGTGHYVLLPTEALLSRAQVYFDLNIENVARLLETSGVEADIAEQVKQDYAAVLSGIYDIKQPLQAQAKVCNTVKPWRVQLTERYGLTLLFTIYMRNSQAAEDYIHQFKLANGHVFKVTHHNEGGKKWEEREELNIPVEEQKEQYLKVTFNRIVSGFFPMLAASFYWIKRNKVEQDGELLDIVEPSDFSGIEPEKVNKFLAYVEAYAGIDDYVNYYYIAKYALKATPDELKEIDFPPIFGEREKAQEYAERIANQRYKNIQEKTAEVEKMIAAETVEEAERARKEITAPPQPAEPDETIRIPETFALLGSRDVYASVDGTPQMGKGILPIQAFIQDYMKRHHLTEQVTPRTVEKVIEGINLLQRLYNVKPNEKGQYTFETNLTEFSELLGYKDANQTQKLEIMRALQVLDGLYLAVWRSDGLKAVRVFNIQEIGLTGVYSGKLTLQVNADTMKGRPQLISYKDFNDMRKDAKGQAENHFRGQILAKGQKEENALLKEVFGYETLLNEIQASGGTAEDIAKAKRNIEKHKSRDKRRIANMFAQYKQRGWLEWYTYTRNGKGEYIYKWRRGNIPKDILPTPQPQEPDEQ